MAALRTEVILPVNSRVIILTACLHHEPMTEEPTDRYKGFIYVNTGSPPACGQGFSPMGGGPVVMCLTV
jgi:hypothetical protein